MFYANDRFVDEAGLLALIKAGDIKQNGKVNPANMENRSYACNDWIKVVDIPIVQEWVNSAPPKTHWCKECQEWTETRPFEIKQKWGYVNGIECSEGHSISSGIGGWWVNEKTAEQRAADAVRSNKENDSGHHHFVP